MKIQRDLRLLGYMVLILFYITLISCETKSKEIDGEELDLLNTPIETSEIPKKEISFPSNISILLPTQYRKEETGYTVDIKDKELLELYKEETSGKWRIEKTEIDIDYGFDECVGVSTLIVPSNHINTVCYFTPFDGIVQELTTVCEDRTLFPGQIQSLKLNGLDYQIIPTGSIYYSEDDTEPSLILKNDSEGSFYADFIKDYRLQIKTPTRTIPLLDLKKMQDVSPKIIWAGDLNGHRLLDVILNIPADYQGQHIFLYLSDPNDKDKPMKLVADLEVLNDC